MSRDGRVVTFREGGAGAGRGDGRSVVGGEDVVAWAVRTGRISASRAPFWRAACAANAESSAAVLRMMVAVPEAFVAGGSSSVAASAGGSGGRADPWPATASGVAASAGPGGGSGAGRAQVLEDGASGSAVVVSGGFHYRQGPFGPEPVAASASWYLSGAKELSPLSAADRTAASEHLRSLSPADFEGVCAALNPGDGQVAAAAAAEVARADAAAVMSAQVDRHATAQRAYAAHLASCGDTTRSFGSKTT